MTRAGKRRCAISFYLGGGDGDTEADGFVMDGPPWRTIWGDLVPERGAEIVLAEQRIAETYLFVSFDYLDFCDGAVPRLMPTQTITAMKAVYEGAQFDVDSVKADHINRRDILLRLVERISGT